MSGEDQADSGSSSSSNEGGSGGGWASAVDVSWVADIADGWGSGRIGPSILNQRDEAGAAERRAAFDRALFRIFSPEVRGNPEQRTVLQAIIERDLWFVPVRSDGSLEPVLAKERQFELAIVASPKLDEKRRPTVWGQGGRLLPIFEQEPGRPAVPLDGRALVRALPGDLDGLLINRGRKRPLELRREHFAALLRAADSYDQLTEAQALAQRQETEAQELTALLLTPAPNQIEQLLRATWWVAEGAWKRGLAEDYWLRARLVHVYTHPGRARRDEVVPLDGATLFQRVAEDESVDGVVVDRGNSLGQGEAAIRDLVLSASFAQRLLAGEDLRPGVQPLPARGRREVELWLDLHRFPAEAREIVEAPLADGPLLRATTGPEPSEWRMQETASRQDSHPGPIWSPVFVLPPIIEADYGYGPGPTRVLCAGLLAGKLIANADGRRGSQSWRPGRWLGFGRLLSASDREQSRQRVMLAGELLKLIPPGADALSRSAIRTVEGASVLRRRPHVASRAWIETTLLQAARYTRRWVWFG